MNTLNNTVKGMQASFALDRSQTDVEGCLVQTTGAYVWVVHNDGSRNWIEEPTAGCIAKALVIPDKSVYPPRDPGSTGAYNLVGQDSVAACANDACIPLRSLLFG